MSIDLNPHSPLARKFRQDLQLSGKTLRTQQSYFWALRKFTEFLGRSPDACSQGDLGCYFLHLSNDRNLAASTVNAAQQALRQYFPS